MSDLINVSLKYFKDNYEGIIEEITKIRLEKIEKRKAYKKAKEVAEQEEEKVLEKVPVPVLERKKEDLVDIMSALEEVTGEHFELSLNVEEEANDSDFSLSYTNDDVIEFEKLENQKKAVWKGKATKGFKEWLKNKYET
jgi:hypothetical protein